MRLAVGVVLLLVAIDLFNINCPGEAIWTALGGILLIGSKK
jgi:hypothetical protein